jgi:hypothetical protein
MTTLTHFKDNKDPLSAVSTPVVSGTDQLRDKVKKGDSGKDSIVLYNKVVILALGYVCSLALLSDGGTCSSNSRLKRNITTYYF